jgi:hypothetical protein
MYPPRIYTYKITFEEVPYYYYGVHKERKYGEYYMGSPVTHKWCWKHYTPKKQILEIFDYTDEGWLEANKVEERLIKPFYNTDKWCLNESCGGVISLEILRETGIINGKKQGKVNYQNKIGFFAISKEERREIGRRSAIKNYQEGIGLPAIPKERRSEISKKVVEKNKINKVGIFSLTKEQMSANGKKNAVKNKINKVGIFGMSAEERRENSKKVNSQKWKCLVTGHISTPGPLTIYQKSRGIDITKRIKLC